MSGIPLMHHPHHDPQKSSTTYLPRSDDREKGLPLMSLSVKSGASLPAATFFFASSFITFVLYRCSAFSINTPMRPFFTSAEISFKAAGMLSTAMELRASATTSLLQLARTNCISSAAVCASDAS